MNNLLISIKKFLSNKNTVTIIGVLVGIAVLYFAYNWRVSEAIKIMKIPYAKQEIPARTLITEAMIDYIKVPQSMVTSNSNLISNSSGVIGKYVSYATTIPKNGLFYDELVMEANEMPDSAFADIPKNFTIYSLNVDLHKTYGNSIFPGNYIDLYFRATDDTTGKLIFGRMIKSIEVLAVKDSSGRHVFETTTEDRTPSELLFAVPDDFYLLLMKAQYINASVEILPVPRNAEYTANPEDTVVTSEYIQEFILNKTTYLPEETEIQSTVTGDNANNNVTPQTETE